VNVQPTNERYVYLVSSDSGNTYRCDLLENNGAGACGCTDFGTRRQPAIRGGALACTPAAQCKHLKEAQLHFLRGILKALAAEENSNAA
jgi:hypothetical protein